VLIDLLHLVCGDFLLRVHYSAVTTPRIYRLSGKTYRLSAKTYRLSFRLTASDGFSSIQAGSRIPSTRRVRVFFWLIIREAHMTAVTPEAVRSEIIAKIQRLEDKMDVISDKLSSNITDIALLKFKVLIIALAASAIMQWAAKVFF